MRRILAPVLAFALLAPTVGAAGRPTSFRDEDLETAVELRQRALDDTVAWAFTEALTTEIGPRLAGGENDLKAREWTIARFKALGFDKVWSEPVTFPKWVRRSESAAVVSPYPQPLAVTALGNSAGTGGPLEAEVVGFDSFDALDAADPATIAGKIVFVNAKMQAHRDGHDYGIGSRVRSRGPALASRKGAAAFVLRSAGTDSERLPHTGVTSFRDGSKPIPAAAVSAPDADQIARMLAQGKPVRLRLDLDCGMDGEYTGANVIGEIRGAKKPDEYFVMGGHLDSWDLGTGAVDDAAGIGISVAAARLIMALPRRPDRSIRVVAFANEEAGLFGGRALAERHAKDIGKAVLGSESDAGAGRIWKLTATVKPEARDAIGTMANLLAPLGVEYDPEAPGRGGSDMSELHRVGMAALSLHQDMTRYFDWHHSANDTLDKVDAEELRQNVAVYAVVAWLAAQAKGDFGSAPGAFAKDTGDH